MALEPLVLVTRHNYTSNGTGSCFAGSDTSNTQTLSVGDVRIADSDVREWKRKIRQGRQATGTFSGTSIELDYSPANFLGEKLCKVSGVEKWARSEVTGPIFTYTGPTLGVPGAPVTTIDTSTDVQARTEFIKRARQAQGSFRGSTFLAEFADTLRGIRNPAAGIRNLLDFYNRRARRNVRKAISKDPYQTKVSDLKDSQIQAGGKALSESWLEAQFGILPLVSDLKSAYEAFNHFADREPRVPVRASVTNSSAVVNGLDNVTLGFWDYVLYVHTKTEYLVKYYGAVKVRTESFKSDLIEESGFRFRDFAPALWEWIPYSFLVDYFTNIGDLIECASFPRSDMAWVGRSYRNRAIREMTRTTFKVVNTAAYPANGFTRTLKNVRPRATWRRSYHSRAAYTGSLVPSFQIEIPGSKGFKKYLNISALALLRGMKR